MDSLKAFLYPKRKENLRFELSDAFVDENGKRIKWEMRELSSQEGIDVQKDIATGSVYDAIIASAAEALVFPDLHSVELLNALSEREGRKILKAKDALIALTTDAELARIYEIYLQHNRLMADFGEKVEEAKN